jgi:DNA-binding response OmpR family regulator
MEKRILIVEDDNFTGESLKSLLEEKGFIIDFVPNGHTAMDYLLAKSYDLVITDLMMPLMDGLHLLNRIKEISENLPVIIITAFGNLENMLAAYQFGAVEILNKPFEMQEILDIINEIMDIN